MKDLEKRCFSESWTPERPTLLLHLHGFAGLGKSEAAVFFVNSHLDKFSLVWRIRVDDEVMYEDDYRVLAKALNILLEKETLEQVIKKVHSKLSMHNLGKPWLLLLDGIEIRVPFPERGGIVLSTSQTEKLWEEQITIPIEPFDLAQTRGFFTREGQITNLDGLELLHEKLQGWPILLSNAYTYIIDAEGTITDYLGELECIEPLFTREETAKYPYSLAQAFGLTLRRLEKKGPEAVKLLFLCAYLNRSEIQLSIFKEKEAAGFLKWKKEVIVLLKNLSIIRLQEETFSLHGLWQAFLTQKLVKEGQAKEQFRLSVEIVKKAEKKFYYENTATWNDGKSCALHIETLQENDKWQILQEKENIILYFTAGKWTYCVQGNAKKARTYFNVILESGLAEDNPLTAISQDNVSILLAQLGEHQLALEYNRKAFESLCKILGKDHPITAITYSNTGLLLADLGAYQQALEKNKKTLDILLKAYGEKHFSTATSYHNVGGLLMQLGRPQEALEYMQKALEIRQKVLGEEHPSTANSHSSLGLLLEELGRPQEALEHVQKALEIGRKALNEEHSDIAASYSNVGFLFGKLERHTEALEYNQKAIDIWRKVVGEEHSSTAISYNNVGASLMELGKPTEALEYSQKALDIWRRVIGEEHPYTAMGYNNVGSFLLELGRWQEALEPLQQSLNVVRKIWGEEHPRTANSYNNVGILLSNLGRPQEALEYLEKALEIRRKKLGEDHPKTATSRKNLLLFHRIDKEKQVLHVPENKIKKLEGHQEALEYKQKFLKTSDNFLNLQSPNISAISDFSERPLREGASFTSSRRLSVKRKAPDSSSFDASIAVSAMDIDFPQSIKSCHDSVSILPNFLESASAKGHLKQTSWHKADIAHFLWQDPMVFISDDMVTKVNTVNIYLREKGFQLKGAKADGNCFFYAFLKSYSTLSRKIPILDVQENKITYLRELISDQYKGSPQGSTEQGIARAHQIKADKEWITASCEGDLLVSILDIPIRLVTVNKDGNGCGVNDTLSFKNAEGLVSQNWEIIPQEETPKEYIFIVDLGGHFVYGDKIS